MHAAMGVQQLQCPTCAVSPHIGQNLLQHRTATSHSPRHAWQQQQHGSGGRQQQLECHICRARRSSALQQLKELQEEDEVEEESQLAPVRQLEWSTPPTVLQYPHPKLRAPNAPVGIFGPELQRLANDMFEVMYRDDGVGLAAPQVGINVRLMVFNPSGERGQGDELVLANPRIISASRKQELGEEGCLSFLKHNTRELILADVERYSHIKVEAQDVDGNNIQRTYTDWTARIFQHEYDHLQGTLFPDRVAKPAKAAIQPFLKELEQNWHGEP